MAFDDQTVLYVTIAANIVIYALFVFRVARTRLQSRATVSNVAEAFRILEGAMRKSFPDLPEGFTWKEAFSRVRRMNLDVNWGTVDAALENYEAYRYGGSRLSEIDPEEVLRLANFLGKGAKFVPRP